MTEKTENSNLMHIEFFFLFVCFLYFSFRWHNVFEIIHIIICTNILFFITEQQLIVEINGNFLICSVVEKLCIFFQNANVFFDFFNPKGLLAIAARRGHRRRRISSRGVFPTNEHGLTQIFARAALVRASGGERSAALSLLSTSSVEVSPMRLCALIFSELMATLCAQIYGESLGCRV